MSSLHVYIYYVLLPIVFYLLNLFPAKTFWIIGMFLFMISVHLYIFIASSNVYRQVKWLYVKFVYTPIVFLLGAFGHFLLMEGTILKIGSVLIATYLFVSLFEHLYFYLYETEQYQTYSLGRLYTHMNLLTILLFFSGSYALIILVRYPIWWFLIMIFFVNFILTLQTLWISSVDMKRAFPYVIAITLILTELFAVLLFLPLGFYALGAIAFICFYLMLRLTRQQLFGNLQQRQIQGYAFSCALLILVILLSSKWT